MLRLPEEQPRCRQCGVARTCKHQQWRRQPVRLPVDTHRTTASLNLASSGKYCLRAEQRAHCHYEREWKEGCKFEHRPGDLLLSKYGTTFTQSLCSVCSLVLPCATHYPVLGEAVSEDELLRVEKAQIWREKLRVPSPPLRSESLISSELSIIDGGMMSCTKSSLFPNNVPKDSTVTGKDSSFASKDSTVTFTSPESVLHKPSTDSKARRTSSETVLNNASTVNATTSTSSESVLDKPTVNTTTTTTSNSVSRTPSLIDANLNSLSNKSSLVNTMANSTRGPNTSANITSTTTSSDETKPSQKLFKSFEIVGWYDANNLLRFAYVACGDEEYELQVKQYHEEKTKRKAERAAAKEAREQGKLSATESGNVASCVTDMGTDTDLPSMLSVHSEEKHSDEQSESRKDIFKDSPRLEEKNASEEYSLMGFALSTMKSVKTPRSNAGDSITQNSTTMSQTTKLSTMHTVSKRKKFPTLSTTVLLVSNRPRVTTTVKRELAFRTTRNKLLPLWGNLYLDDRSVGIAALEK